MIKKKFGGSKISGVFFLTPYIYIKKSSGISISYIKAHHIQFRPPHHITSYYIISYLRSISSTSLWLACLLRYRLPTASVLAREGKTSNESRLVQVAASLSLSCTATSPIKSCIAGSRSTRLSRVSVRC